MMLTRQSSAFIAGAQEEGEILVSSAGRGGGTEPGRGEAVAAPKGRLGAGLGFSRIGVAIP